MQDKKTLILEMFDKCNDYKTVLDINQDCIVTLQCKDKKTHIQEMFDKCKDYKTVLDMNQVVYLNPTMQG